jgi:hypothetical protein
MDFNKNIDKFCENPGSDLYDGVLSLTLGDGTEPLTLQEAKDWDKIDQDVDDDIITALITAARRICEKFSGIGFINRTIDANINNSNGGFQLPYGPITGDPTAADADGNTLDLTYQFGQIISPRGRMTVSYTAGYTTLPEDLKTALKAQVLFLYENRGESTVAVSPIAKMILEPLREVV